MANHVLASMKIEEIATIIEESSRKIALEEVECCECCNSGDLKLENEIIFKYSQPSLFSDGCETSAEVYELLQKQYSSHGYTI